MTRQEWMLKPWECHKACANCDGCQSMCDVGMSAQKKLLDFIIKKINACEEPVTLGTLKDMRKKLGNDRA
jgi:hypothetical protein